MLLLKFTAFLGTLHLASAQSLLVAIESYPQLSQFAALLTANPTLATGLLSVSAISPKTLLIPNNNAFLTYQTNTGLDIANTEKGLLSDTLSYHTLNGSYNARSFVEPKGVTIPTLLSGETYNNRSAGAALASDSAGERNGQVVFVSSKEGGSGLRVRQLGSDGGFVRSGLASDVSLTTTEGVWDGGRFHIVDGFLTLPQTCPKTISAKGLTSLSASLERTDLIPVLNNWNNVTCLGPTNAAFLAAGSPDVKLDKENLTQALQFHTIPQPLYSNFLISGQTFQSANNLTIRVTLDGDDIYFNDAKVLEKNVLTNNGLIYVLDRIMSPLKANETVPTKVAPPSTTASSTASATVTGSSTAFTQVPTAAAESLKGNMVGLSLLQFVAVVVGFGI